MTILNKKICSIYNSSFNTTGQVEAGAEDYYFFILAIVQNVFAIWLLVYIAIFLSGTLFLFFF